MLSTYNHCKYNHKMSYRESYDMVFLPNSLRENNIWKKFSNGSFCHFIFGKWRQIGVLKCAGLQRWCCVVLPSTNECIANVSVQLSFPTLVIAVAITLRRPHTIHLYPIPIRVLKKDLLDAISTNVDLVGGTRPV